MAGIRIVTDSTTDLPKELLNKYDIEVIPLSVYVDGETYLDNVTITPLEFIERMRGSSELPKTSLPPVGVFVDTYNRLGENGDTILSIHMASGLSGTYNAACLAAEMTTMPAFSAFAFSATRAVWTLPVAADASSTLQT